MTATEISVYLQHLQNSRGMTQQGWSDASGVPAYTISRYLSGAVDSPPFSAVAALVKAAGGSLDEMAGIAAPEKPVPQHAQELIDQKERSIVYLKEQVAGLKNEIAAERHTVAKLRKGIAWRTAVISAMLFIFGGFLMWDLSDPRYGFIYRVFGVHDIQCMLTLIKG